MVGKVKRVPDVKEGMRILLVEDSAADALLIERAVSREFPGAIAQRVMNPADFAAALDSRSWDIVLADHKLPSFSSWAAIEQLERSGLDVPLVVVSGAIGEEEAVDLLKAGAHDFVRKDNLARLGPVLRRELADAENRRRRRDAEAALTELQSRLMGASRLMLMGELATGIAHEVKQPLAAIRIYAEGLAEQIRAGAAGGPDLAPILDRIVDQNRKAQAVIDRILAFVRRSVPQMAELDVNQAVRDAVKLFEVEAGNADVRLDLCLAPDVPVVTGDAVQIQQVIINLLRNGLDAITEAGVPGGELRVETAKAEDGGIDVTVMDNGPGIAEAVRARAFIPFFTTKPDGFGLGLTICSKVVEDHGGRLSIDAPAGGGTVVRFRLPARP